MKEVREGRDMEEESLVEVSKKQGLARMKRSRRQQKKGGRGGREL